MHSGPNGGVNWPRTGTSTPRPAAATAASMSSVALHAEREILGHLVAGRTSAEIVAELVIGEKTVSVHASKHAARTGTSSRVELAGLARRMDGPAAGR
jgi:DNA-binding NarL/FixJ family response regulator